MTVFACVDHAAGAAEVGLSLRPTAVLIFGNAKGGTPLMQSNQTMGIDLPLKALVWEDASGNTWLSYNDPVWLGKRHELSSEYGAKVSAMATMLALIAEATTTAPYSALAPISSSGGCAPALPQSLHGQTVSLEGRCNGEAGR
jgi:uncharacterized protein (DUF302 family)